MNSKLDDTRLLVETLKSKVSWQHFFTVVSHVGDELNERKLRFDKSDLVEQAIAEFSSGTLRWVDEIGHDFIALEKVPIEMKYAKGALTTDSGRVKKSVKTLKLVNTLSGGTDRLLENTFDYLLLCDQRSTAVVSFEEVRSHSVATSDSINLKNLSTSNIQWLARPGEYEPLKMQIELSYREMKRLIQRDYLMQFKSLPDDHAAHEEEHELL